MSKLFCLLSSSKILDDEDDDSTYEPSEHSSYTSTSSSEDDNDIITYIGYFIEHQQKFKKNLQQIEKMAFICLLHDEIKNM